MTIQEVEAVAKEASHEFLQEVCDTLSKVGIQESYVCGFLAGASFGRKQALEEVEQLICKQQLSAADSNSRDDIKQGHWIACANIRTAIRALAAGGDA